LRSHPNPRNPPQQILLLLPPNLSRCRQLPSTTKQTNKQTNTRLENLPLFFFTPARNPFCTK
jgi:hypothetical protein